MRAELARLARDYGLEIDVDAIVGDLSVGLQQRVEILKALYRGADILILDEPTAVLTPPEADALFELLRALKEQGKTVILITHKLREIMAVTDRVSVMRRGEMVATLETADTSPPELAELMVGRRVLLRVEKAERAPGAPLLEVDNLSVDRRPRRAARRRTSSFAVRAGEIVGIAGVAGNGQSELLEAHRRHAPAGARLDRGSRGATIRRASTTRIGCASSACCMCRRTGCAWGWCRPSRPSRARSSASATSRGSGAGRSSTMAAWSPISRRRWSITTCARRRRA